MRCGSAVSGRGAAPGLNLLTQLFREARWGGGAQLSLTDIEILRVVVWERAAGRSPSLKSLQADLSRPKTVVKYHVDQLVRRHFLYMSTDMRDRRRSLVLLTERAESLIDAFEKTVRVHVAEYQATVARTDSR